MPTPRAITRNVLLLGLVSFLTDVSSDMIIPLLPVFITQTLKADIQWLGYIEGVAETTASVFKLLAGWLADRLGRRKPLVVIGYTLSTISRPLMAIAGAGWHILVVRFFDRVGKGIRGAPRDALIADTTEPAMLGRAFGFHRSMDNLGGVLGPLVASGILLLAPGNLRLVFWCAFVPGILTIPLLLSVREPKTTPASGDNAAAATPKPSAKPVSLSLKPFSPTYRRYLLVVIVFTLGNSSDMFLIARAKDMGMRDALLPIYWLAMQLVKMLLAYPGGIACDRFGKRPMLIVGWFIYALAYAGFGLASRQSQLWALVILYGLFYGLTESSERAIVSEMVPKELKAAAYGLFNFAVGVTLLPASVLTGWLYASSFAGPAAAFITCAALALIASLMLALVPLAPKANAATAAS